MRKIGVMGGSFDPVHNGHIRAAHRAMDFAGLCEVWFVPTAVSPFKIDSSRSSAEHRFAMLCMALADEPRFRVSTVELERGGVSYTFDTVSAMKEKFPDIDFSFIIGSDSLATLPMWRRSAELVWLCDFITLARPGWTVEKPKGLDDREWGRISRGIIPDFSVDVSSSEIRRMVRRGRMIHGLVSPRVAEYIERNRLYAASGR